RTIRLQPRLKRLFTLCVAQRMAQWSTTQDALPRTQNGFRSGYRTADNIFIIRTMQETHNLTNTSLFACSADVSKAFDNVSRPLLFELLSACGLNGALLD
ncbi:hypothetical protein BJ508DRAFT_201604, partial [Ascobolus immersus RN42]